MSEAPHTGERGRTADDRYQAYLSQIRAEFPAFDWFDFDAVVGERLSDAAFAACAGAACLYDDCLCFLSGVISARTSVEEAVATIDAARSSLVALLPGAQEATDGR